MSEYRYSRLLFLVWMSLWAFFTLVFIKYQWNLLFCALFLDVTIEIGLTFHLARIYNATLQDLVFHVVVRAVSILCLAMARYLLYHVDHNNRLAELKIVYYTSFITIYAFYLYVRKRVEHLTQDTSVIVPVPQVILFENVVCTICSEPIVNNQTIYHLYCQHTFHKSCLVPWFSRSNTCPNCRSIINIKL